MGNDKITIELSSKSYRLLLDAVEFQIECEQDSIDIARDQSEWGDAAHLENGKKDWEQVQAELKRATS